MNRDQALIALGRGKTIGLSVMKDHIWFMRGDEIICKDTGGKESFGMPSSEWLGNYYIIDARQVPAPPSIKPDPIHILSQELSRLSARIYHLEYLHNIEREGERELHKIAHGERDV